MITDIEITNIRGIHRGELHSLKPLVVLVGRNGAGKSTVLEALAVGASHQPGDAIGRVVQSRAGWRGSRWLVGRAEEDGTLVVKTSDGNERSVTLKWDESPSELTAWDLPPGDSPGPHAVPYTAIEFEVSQSGTEESIAARTVFAIDNRYRFKSIKGLLTAGKMRFVHPSMSREWPLWKSLRTVSEAGLADEVHELLSELLGDDFIDLYPFPEGDDGGSVNVHLRYKWGSVPVAIAGDGIRTLVRLALELAGTPGSVVLIEEPEVHQHPGAIWQTAQAVLAATMRGVQIIISTHSLELIDALVELAEPETLDLMELRRLALTEGVLKQTVVPGLDVQRLRQTIVEDLR